MLLVTRWTRDRLLHHEVVAQIEAHRQPPVGVELEPEAGVEGDALHRLADGVAGAEHEEDVAVHDRVLA